MRDRGDDAAASEPGGGVRIDKWLWAARFYKTRSLAADAITSGKIELNGERTKPAKTVKAGDILRIRQGVFEQIVAVKALSGSRGPAKVAQTLYEETAESAAARAKLAERMRYEMPAGTDTGRPSKKDRRDISRLRRR
jgi:ribosome-associated heat shock protein Hsp15